jgi:uncharacterized protein (TIGR03437 family)
MNLARPMFLLATVVGLFATIAPAAPVSRFIFGTYPKSLSLTSQPLVAADAEGSTYLAGTRSSTYNRPLHDGGPYSSYNPILAKVSQNGQTIFSNTLAGGIAYAIAVGPSGDLYLAGASIAVPPSNFFDFNSPGIPAIQPTDGALHSNPAYGFVARYKPDGAIVFVATLSAIPKALAIDSSGGVYMTGVAASDFQTTPSSFQPTIKNAACRDLSQYVTGTGCFTAFAAKISPDGSTLLYATFLGGSAIDLGLAISVNTAGSAYIAGTTVSADFPLYGAGIQSRRGGNGDIFVSQFDPSGGKLVFSTVIGGSGSDAAGGLAIDSSGSAYVAGTTSSPDFPVTESALQKSYGGGASDGFILKLDTTGAIIFSTFIGSAASDFAGPLLLNTDGRVYIVVSSSPVNSFLPTAGQRIYSTLLNRPPADCDPWGVIVALNPKTGVIADFEGLVGFPGSVQLSADASGILHLFNSSSATGDFVITDGQWAGSNYSYLLARLDFTRSDIFQPACIANPAAHTYAASSSLTALYVGQRQLAAGEIITIGGKGLGPVVPWHVQPGRALPYQVAQTEVTLDSNPLPLISVSDTEISAVIPYSQPSGRNPASLMISNGEMQLTLTFGVAPWAGAVFAAMSGMALAVNQDGTANSPANPALRGSIVSLYATGMGPLVPPLGDNLFTPLSPPWSSLTYDPELYIQPSQQQMPVLYAGPAPGEVPGVYQLNVQIPETAPVGNVEVLLLSNVPGASYQSVRLAVQ